MSEVTVIVVVLVDMMMSRLPGFFQADIVKFGRKDFNELVLLDFV